MEYEVVIGLEIHIQLATRTKLFSGDANRFGNSPNSLTSPLVLGHPGTLPKTNKAAVALAVQLGLACGCTIARENYFARKNYFYPDLPKGYQISQHTTPICLGGAIEITVDNQTQTIALNRIHLEEDAGKSLHDQYEDVTCIDLNRAGTPLVELVTEPVIFSAAAAAQFVTEVRKLVRWLGVSDGNMEEGSLRCDANLSLRPLGGKTLGTKVEVKNLNSIKHVRKAIEAETERMTHLLQMGQIIRQETRGFDAQTETTFSQRDKEEANDYRYFPDPDLPAFLLQEDWIKQQQIALPILPAVAQKKLMEEMGLGAYDAAQLCEDKLVFDFFQACVAAGGSPKPIANWITGPIRQYLNETQTGLSDFPLQAPQIVAMIQMVEAGDLHFSQASQQLFRAWLKNPTAHPKALATDLGLVLVKDNHSLEKWVMEVLAEMPDKVMEYQKGKKGLMGLFVGAVKKKSKGSADPLQVTALLEEKLKK